MPFGLGVLGGFDGGAQVGTFDHGLDAVDELLAALDFTRSLGAQVCIQALQDLLEAPVQVLAIRSVDRSELVPLFLSAAAQPVSFAPIHLLPIGDGFELFQLVAEGLFFFEILLALAVLCLEIGLTRRVGALASLVEPLPQRLGSGALAVVQGFPGFADLLDALSDIGRISLQADQVFDGDAELLAGLVSALAPPIVQFADAAGAVLQAFLDGRHLRAGQPDVVF